ncbi:GNAT family N-acetyltransferase [Planococcus sp. SE5232]|uniref:GNAT family N-acetyltransferase n=1 Tax=unclassified Planococcus (in: firmicutes) TaxID=2662419 RepID=UPI003D6C22F2
MTVKTPSLLPDIFFLPEWGSAYAKQEKGKNEVFEFVTDFGRVHYQFVVRPIPIEVVGITYYDTITPFGPGGPLIISCAAGRKKELVAAFDAAFQEYCMDHHIVSEYVRFNSWVKNAKDFEEIYSIDNRGISMYIDLTVDDYFMEEFKSSTRQQVRRALKNNVEIEYDYTGSTVDEFHRLYEIMANRNNIPNHYRFSKELLAESFTLLKGKQFIVYAKYEGHYISGSLYVHHREFLHYHLAANDPEFFCVAGNSLVLNEGCRWGVEHNKKQLHLGGATSDELYRFKRGFTKTTPLDILTGKKIRNEMAYKLLSDYQLSRGAIENPDYFPLYRG